MVKKICIFLIPIVVLLSISNVSAAEFEEKDTPISFKIEMVPWSMVNEILPRRSYFTIIDVETGLSFRVQRRAGSRHADVQPLTIKDTKIMKRIYSGKWSWKRRAIIVKYGDQMIAASMHGMPHGAGALKNGFRGHFCVHFLGSTTHGSQEPDLDHFLMILKAGGKVGEYINGSDPYQLVDILSSGINQGDKQIIELTLAKSKNKKKVVEELQEIHTLRIKSLSYLPIQDMNHLLAFEASAEVEIYREHETKEIKAVKFVMSRSNLVDRWYIQPNSLKGIVKDK